MPVTADAMLSWCRRLLGYESSARPESLKAELDAIPRLESLADLPSGTTVLVRGDVDAKPGAEVGQGDIRLRSMVETLNFGRQQGWIQILFGHIGRDPRGTLSKVAARLGQLLESEVELIPDWWDESTGTIPESVVHQVKSAQPGTMLMLDNTRRYEVERILWKAQEADLPQAAEPLAQLANQFAEGLANVYVNEALSAGSLDSSTTVIPAAMQRVALGQYVARELEGPMQRCLEAQMVVFSGLKIDKLDDLEAMTRRGNVQLVIAAGSLAMALKKAAAQLDGGDFCLGVAENPDNAKQPYYIPQDRIEQAQRMMTQGRENGIRFALPVDFVLQDGRVSEQIGPEDQQFDVGPRSRAAFADEVDRFIEQHAGQAGVAFYNGVFGMFEDERFEGGTREFIPRLKRMKDAGIEVYVGGGEGGKALDRYGQEDWVTHCFTAGGTVLNALGGDPIPYLVALRMAAQNNA
jgi:phosphoglycerate kinase